MDIQSTIEQMTLEEKASLCSGATAWTSTPIERLGVPEMIVADGPHGVRREESIYEWGAGGTRPATCFPTASCLVSTWYMELLYRMGEALAVECIALDVDVLLGPGVYMKRSPLGGRNFEYFSEDPYLSGELAVSLINGIQSKGVGTSLKHYAANNQEFRRFSINAAMDERTLREWMNDPHGKAVFSGYYTTIEANVRKKFEGDESGDGHDAAAGAPGMDIMEMFNEMPVVSVLLFQPEAWSEHPEDIVADLLAKVHGQAY